MTTPWVFRHATLRALAALCFLWAVSFGLTIPFLTLTARDRGVSIDAIGLIAASYLITQIFLQVPFGALSDRVGRVGPLALGIALFAIATAGFVVADSTVAFMVLRAAQGVGFALGYPAFRALVADVTAPDERGRAYAAMGTAYSTGILIGPGIGGGFASMVSRDTLFLLTAALDVALAIAVIVVLRGAGRPGLAHADTERVPMRAAFTLPLLGAFLLAFAGYFQLGFVESIWGPYVADLGGSDLVVGLSFTTIAIAKVILQPWGGRLADRGDQPRLLLIGFTAMAFVMMGYGMTPWLVGILVLGFFEGAAAAIAFPALDALLAGKTDPRIQGRVQGIFSSSMMAGATLSALGGPLLYTVSPGLPFVIGGLALVIVCPIAVGMIRGSAPPVPAGASVEPAAPSSVTT
jgi:MFS family permease